MTDFGELKRVSLREIWPKEASDFTPWLAENLSPLGEALGLDLELIEREASAGDFSLDVLARDLGTGRKVVIENQLTPTDHDHLGKLMTYASAFDAGVVVWVAESLRDEHRQALEWLNQRTDSETSFFGVVVEVLQIDSSRAAYHFRPVIFPNEWRKGKRAASGAPASARGEAYRSFFQALIDELRERHHFTNARAGQPQNWYSFASGISGISYGTSFAQGDRVRAEVYIDRGDGTENKELFDKLYRDRSEIEREFGEALDWERLDDKRACRVAAYCSGHIETSSEQLDEIRQWAIDRMLKFKKVFDKRVRASLAVGGATEANN